MQAMAVVAVAAVIVIGLVCYGLYMGVRGARRQARRAAGRVARAMPGKAFGADVWRLGGLLDNATTRAGRAAAAAGETAFASDVACLAEELADAAVPVRHRVTVAGRLTEPARSRALDAVRSDVDEIVGAADALETLAARAVATVTAGPSGPAADVRRRATALHVAIEELTRPEYGAAIPPLAAALPPAQPPELTPLPWESAAHADASREGRPR